MNNKKSFASYLLISHKLLAAMEREPNMAMVAPGRKSKMQNSALATILKANCSLIFL